MTSLNRLFYYEYKYKQQRQQELECPLKNPSQESLQISISESNESNESHSTPQKGPTEGILEKIESSPIKDILFSNHSTRFSTTNNTDLLDIQEFLQMETDYLHV